MPFSSFFTSPSSSSTTTTTTTTCSLHRYFSTALTLLCFSQCVPAAVGASLADEGAELLLLHDYCGWNISSWSAGALSTVCSWEFVECNSGDQHVQALRITPPLLAGSGAPYSCDLTGFDVSSGFNPGNLDYVQLWQLAGLGLSGPPPESFFQFRSLLELNLAQNALAGQIESYDVSSPALQTLHLYDNDLSGALCDLTRHTRITDIDVSKNLFSGDLVTRLGTQERLVSLKVSQNALTGPLPDFSASQTHLNVLHLASNLFTGTIPDRLASVGSGGSGIREIDFGGNQLTGRIPDAVAFLPSTLRLLDLSDNTLSGHLPAALAYLYVTTGPDLTVDLSGNTDFLCPVPSTSAVYDTATCTCAAGWYGAQGPLDGALWNASRCRNEISGDFEYTGDAGNCAGLSRFGCSQCSATSANNRFSAVDWASSCATCSLGSFVVADDIDGRRSTCVSCTAEVTSAAAVGARGCETCGPGFYMRAGTTSCVACATGFFNNGTDASSACDLCRAGSFSADGSTCQRCRPGYFQNSDGQTQCKGCTGGQFASSRGAQVCDVCAAGTFFKGITTFTETFEEGVDGCQPCGQSSYSSEGAAACVPCGEAGLGSTDEEVDQCRLVLLTNSDAVYGSLGAIGVLFAVAVALIVARVLAPHRDVDDDEFDDARYGTTDQTVMVLGATGWIGARIASEAGLRDGIFVIGSCRHPPSNPATMPFVDRWRKCDLTITAAEAAQIHSEETAVRERAKQSLEANLHGVDVLIVCISHRHKGDFDFSNAKDSEGRKDLRDDLFLACLRVLVAAITEGERRQKSRLRQSGRFSLKGPQGEPRGKGGSAKIHPALHQEQEESKAEGYDDADEAENEVGDKDEEEEDPSDLDFESLNIIFVGTANHSVFEVQTGDTTPAERQKLHEEAACYERFFSFLCEENLHGEKEFLTAKLKDARVTWSIISPQGNIVDSDDSDRRRQINMTSISAAQRIHQAQRGGAQVSSEDHDMDESSAPALKSTPPKRPARMSPDTFAWGVVGCVGNRCQNKKIFLTDPVMALQPRKREDESKDEVE